MIKDKDQKFIPIYKVGKVSQMLGIHPQTVRYFDKVGIVPSEKHRHHNVRLFSTYDVYQIMIRKQYRNMGFSVEETDTIFHEADYEEINHLIQQQLALKQKEVQKQQYYIRGMQQLSEKLQAIPLFYNKCFYKVRPAKWHHIHLKDGLVVESDNCTQARQIAMEALPLCDYSVGIRRQDIQTRSDAESTYCELSMDLDVAQFFGFDTIATAHLVPEMKCLYTVVKIEAHSAVTWQDFQHVQKFLEDNQLQLSGDVYVNTLVNAFDSETNIQRTRYRYFEAYIPFENKL